MARTSHRKHAADPAPEPDSLSTVRCKLFSDIVTEHLCVVRKKELNRKDAFSCAGCHMEDRIRERLRLMKEVLSIGRRQADPEQ
jgi:hypothetical protein